MSNDEYSIQISRAKKILHSSEPSKFEEYTQRNAALKV